MMVQTGFLIGTEVLGLAQPLGKVWLPAQEADGYMLTLLFVGHLTSCFKITWLIWSIIPSGHMGEGAICSVSQAVKGLGLPYEVHVAPLGWQYVNQLQMAQSQSKLVAQKYEKSAKCISFCILFNAMEWLSAIRKLNEGCQKYKLWTIHNFEYVHSASWVSLQSFPNWLNLPYHISSAFVLGGSCLSIGSHKSTNSLIKNHGNLLNLSKE